MNTDGELIGVEVGVTRLQSRSIFSLALAVVAFAITVSAASFEENFSHDPNVSGWHIAGNAQLFQWDSANKNLKAEWNSSRTNSFCFKRLPTVLTRSDDFSFEFELLLTDVQLGVSPGKPFTFELAFGLINTDSIQSTNLHRGSGINATTGPRNLVEFDYFPDSGFGATISPTLVSSNNQFATGFNFPLEMTTGAVFSVTMNYQAAQRTLTTMMTRDGTDFGPISPVKLPDSFADFRGNAIAIVSYNDADADGSILAHGAVRRIKIVFPDPPISALTIRKEAASYSMEFQGAANWTYQLERSIDFRIWESVSNSVDSVVLQKITLRDEPAIDARIFYRIHAQHL